MKPLRWPTNEEMHAYMKMRQGQNKTRCTKAESWMDAKLSFRTAYSWTKQATWGYRLFDFWCCTIGCAVEVDGPEHDAEYDRYRDEYNFRRSGIVVVRANNFDEQMASSAIDVISRLSNWNSRRDSMGLTIRSTRKRIASQSYEHSLLDEYVATLRHSAPLSWSLATATA